MWQTVRRKMRTEKESFKGYEMKYMEIVSLIDIRQINLTGFHVPHITQAAKIFFLVSVLQ